MPDSPTLSIALPYLSTTGCVDLCRDLIRENTAHDHEIVEVVDCRDVYAAYNEAAERAKGEVLAFLNDDMFVAPDWDRALVAAAAPKTVVTTYLVECGRISVNARNIARDFGRTPAEFRRAEFEEFALQHSATVPDVAVGFGWYMPFAIRREDFIPFPNERKGLPSDTLLFGVFGSRGYSFRRARSYAYHLQRMSDWTDAES